MDSSVLRCGSNGTGTALNLSGDPTIDFYDNVSTSTFSIRGASGYIFCLMQEIILSSGAYFSSSLFNANKRV
jgi:hypothetical protein